MTRPLLSRDVRKLLETDLDSVEKLEALRYLQSVRRPITRTELVRALGLPREVVHAAIGELGRAGMLEPTGERGGLQLGPRAVGDTFDELMRIYDEDRVAIVSALSSIAVERIRGMAARAFGEALAGKKRPDIEGEGEGEDDR